MIALLLAATFALQRPPQVRDDPTLVESLRAIPALKGVLERAAELRVQVLLAAAEPDAKGRPVLARRGFRVDSEYFCPAGALQLLAAIAALEDVNERHAKDARITEDTPLAFHPLFAGEAIESRDLNHADGSITLRHEIRKLFLASDDAASNRLYEYVGQDALAKLAARAGFSSARIVHRLSQSRSEEEDRRSPRIDFVLSDTERVTVSERTSKLKIVDLRSAGIQVGTSYVDGTRVVDQPMSFARKNSILLVELQDALAKLVDAEILLDGEPYSITPPQRDFLLRTAAEFPGDSRDPRFPKAEYGDAFGKFLLPGLERVAPKAAWRIVNKVGRSQGFSTENAWVVHGPTNRSMFVAATIYTNSNGVLNDGKYEYESVADPFFAALGEMIGRELAP